MKDETKLWVNQAKDDYESSEVMLKNNRYGYTCFCAQQTLEKIFKAAIVELTNKRPVKSHDLVKLSEDSGLKISKAKMKKLAEISKHYFRVRYPDMHKGIYTNNKIPSKTFKDSEKIYLWVLKKLNQSSTSI